MPTEIAERDRYQINLAIDGVPMQLSCIGRAGTGSPVVFLHGFGSTKEDYADFAFEGRPFLAYDAPGCGETVLSDPGKISIPFRAETGLAALDSQSIDTFHLVGHSMGGLTALLLAEQQPDRVISFVDIEGNLAPEDCFLSRQIASHRRADADTFLQDFIARNDASGQYSASLYASSLAHKVRAAAVEPIFTSMVDLSDHAPLLETFLALPMPRMFMYGEQNSTLSYLPRLDAGGVRLAEIPRSGHWPMYANAAQMWQQITEFHRTVEHPRG